MASNLAALRIFPPTAKCPTSIFVPGSKSITNRAILLAALGKGEVSFTNASMSDDSLLLLQALEPFGVKFDCSGNDLRVAPPGDGFELWKGEVDVGHAGTTSRFLTAFFASLPGSEVVLTGSKRLCERPIGGLVDALKSLGAAIEYLSREGSLPLKIKGGKLRGGEVAVDCSSSSQFLTALLLVSLRCERPLQVRPVGKLASRSYASLTARLMTAWGVKTVESGAFWEAAGHFPSRNPQRFTIEPDASGASYFWAAGALLGVPVTIPGLFRDSLQGDAEFPWILEKMGAEVTETDKGITVSSATKLHAANVDLHLMPDVAQTLGVVAACAQGRSTLTGLETLPQKETDRLSALEKELHRVGISAEQQKSREIVIDGGRVQAGRINVYDDHRMAMSFSLLSTHAPGIEISDPHVVSKSYPSYWDDLARLGFLYEEIT